MRIVTVDTNLGPDETSWVLRFGDENEGHGLGEVSAVVSQRQTDFHHLAALLPWELDLTRDVRPQIDALVADFKQRRSPPTASACSETAFAVETALFDLVGKRLGQPVHTLLSPTTATTSVPINALIATVDNWLGQADCALARGIRTLKVKIGRRPFLIELADLHELRRHVGTAVAIRVDVNGAWTLAEAPEFLTQLAPLGLEYVEQPVCAEDLAQLTNSPVPLAADETLAVADGFGKIAAAQNCAVIVLKPSRLGGLLACTRLAKQAHARGMGAVVTHAFEGPVGFAACCELALSLAVPSLVCGLDPHNGLAVWKPLRISHRIGTDVVPSGEPGLGITR